MRLALASLALTLSLPAVAAPAPGDSELITFERLVVRDEVSLETATSDEGFRVQMLDIMREEGFNVAGGEDLVFGEDKTETARFRVGGEVIDGDCNLELWWATCQVQVEWRVFDEKLGGVVYEVTTRGEDVFSNPTGEGKTLHDIIGSSFKDCYQRLLRRETFLSLVAGEGVKAKADAAEVGVAPCRRAHIALPGDLDEAKRSVVLIETRKGTGSGVIVSPDGFLVTAAHVVGQQQTVDVDTGTMTLPAKLLRSDAEADLALLRMDGSGFSCTPLATTPPGAGEAIFALGHPAGEALSHSLSKGVVSAVRDLEGVEVLQTDIGLSPGHSGGALLDPKGRAVAVITSKADGKGFEGIGFGVTSAAVVETLGITWGASTDTGEVQSGGKLKALVDESDPGLDLLPAPDGIRAGRSMSGLGATMSLVGWTGAIVGGTFMIIESDGPSATSTGVTVGSVALALGGSVISRAGRRKAQRVADELVVVLGPTEAAVFVTF